MPSLEIKVAAEDEEAAKRSEKARELIQIEQLLALKVEAVDDDEGELERGITSYSVVSVEGKRIQIAVNFIRPSDISSSIMEPDVLSI